MTIAIGMRCVDGVVIAADRQITKEGGLKYQEDKILDGGTVVGNPTLNFALAYCGSPDLAKNLLERIGEVLLNGCGGIAFLPSAAEAGIRKILTPKETKGLETLIIIGGPKVLPFMLRTRETRIVSAQMECIGVGDSSVIRYLVDLADIRTPISLERCRILCAYMISVANRYIDGCGFGPDLAFIDVRIGEVQRPEKEEIDSYATEFADLERALRNTIGILWGRLRKLNRGE